MAGDWIKLRVNIHDDPAVISISKILEMSCYEVVGKLAALWAWADQQCDEQGRALGVTKEWIDVRISSAGFADAMETVGWLVSDSESIAFPRFARHNGRPAKRRAEDASRKRKNRGCPDDVGTESKKYPQRLRTESGQRADQRREEKSNTPLSPPKGGGREKPVDPVWDAVCLHFGMDPQTRTEKSRIGAIVRDLKLKLRGEDPAQAIQARAQVHRRIWPNVNPVTPESLLKHWDTLSRAPELDTTTHVRLGVSNVS